jgi:diguanylate cyclase (GGDEF)-like protein
MGRSMRRLPYAVRLLFAVVLTLVVVLVGGRELVSRAMETGFVEEQASDYTADARTIEGAAADASGDEAPLDEAQEIVAAIAARPSVAGVELLDDQGRVQASSEPESVGDIEDGPAVAVARGAPALAGAEAESHEDADSFEYAVPLEIAGKRFALEVDQDRAALDHRTGQFDRYLLLLGLAALPLGGFLFFLFGGHALLREHADTVGRSLSDGLTGLGNHSAFQEHVAREIAVAERHAESLSLAIVDIDDFKFFNDTLGHQYGDHVLKGVASALASGRATNGCFRIGGDEFAVVLPRTGLAGARVALEAAAARLAVELPGVPLSVGLADLTSAGHQLDLFWEQADVALYEAKRAPGTAIVAFDDISSSALITHPDKVRALRRLIDDDEMEMAFQPIWDLDGNDILGYEALARPAAEYGFDGPGEAFELAEKTGSAHLLCESARQKALARAHELPSGALLFLNISPSTLEHDLLADDSFVLAVRGAGLEPSQVVLELTEHSTTRLGEVVREIDRLRRLGFKVSLDDVGAGNAGLELLSSISPDFVKIDGSIVRNATSDPSAHGVLEAVIAYARRTSAFVIAEGVETSEQLELVRHPFSTPPDEGTGVAGAQGFLLGRPAPGFADTDALAPA